MTTDTQRAATEPTAGAGAREARVPDKPALEGLEDGSLRISRGKIVKAKPAKAVA